VQDQASCASPTPRILHVFLPSPFTAPLTSCSRSPPPQPNYHLRRHLRRPLAAAAAAAAVMIMSMLVCEGRCERVTAAVWPVYKRVFVACVHRGVHAVRGVVVFGWNGTLMV
jgi:hypothetical protein